MNSYKHCAHTNGVNLVYLLTTVLVKKNEKQDEFCSTNPTRPICISTVPDFQRTSSYPVTHHDE